MQAAMAASSWLVGHRDYVVHDVIQDSGSSSSSSGSSRSNSSDATPKANKAGSSKEGAPISADGKTPSSTTIHVVADATGGSQTLKQGPAKSSKKKSGKKKERKGSESVGNQTMAADDGAAKTVEQQREEEEEEDNTMFKVAGKSRGSRGKKRTAADSSAPLSIKGTVQTRPELITGLP